MKLIDNYRKLGAKDFVAKWKEGITQVTPLQQLKAQLPSYILMMVGILLGIVVSSISKTWWLVCILVAALGINGMSFLGVYQRYLMLKKVDDELKVMENNEKEVSKNAS